MKSRIMGKARCNFCGLHFTNLLISLEKLKNFICFLCWLKEKQGEKYPCKPDIFEKTYEAVTDESR